MKIIEITDEEAELIEKVRKIPDHLYQYFIDIVDILARGAK